MSTVTISAADYGGLQALLFFAIMIAVIIAVSELFQDDQIKGD